MSEQISMTGLVTGAARPAGRAVARDLAAQGWRLALQDDPASDGALRALAAELGGVALAADLADQDEAAALAARAVAAVGPLGALIGAACVDAPDDLASIEPAAWDRHMRVNLRAPLLLLQGFARQLPEGAGGAAVFIIPRRVWPLTGGHVSATVSQSALWTLAQSAALGLAPRIRVNAVGSAPSWGGPPAAAAAPEEIAAAVRFLLAAPAMTGQMIALEDGQPVGRWAPGGPSPRE